MKKVLVTIAVMAMLGLSAAEIQAQQGKGKGGGGWGASGPYSRMYDPRTVETIRGKVVSIDEITPMKGMHHGVHAVVETEKETISVHLGPSWYVENQEITIEPKDEVEVKGSRVTFDGKPAIIAAEVEKGEEVLVLRDENGRPRWSGWRRR